MSIWVSPIRCVECSRRSRFTWDTTRNPNKEPMIKHIREHAKNVYSFVCDDCAEEKA